MQINKNDTFSMDSNILVSTRPFTPPPSRLSNRPEDSTALSPILETTDPFLLMEPCKGMRHRFLSFKFHSTSPN